MKYGCLLFVWAVAASSLLGQNVDTDGDGLTDAYEIGFGRYEVILGAFTWDEANVDAATKGGHLATAVSTEEWNALRQVLGDKINGQNLWLGGTEFGTEGFWHWITNEEWKFSNWRAGEPLNDSQGTGAGQPELYILQLGKEGVELGWASAANNGGVYPVDGYVLERGLHTDPTKAETDGNGLPDGAEQALGHFYEVVRFPEGILKTWSECKADAEIRGGHLVTVTTLVEHQVAGYYLAQALGGGGLSPFGVYREADQNSRRVFRWGSQEPFFLSLYDVSSLVPSVDGGDVAVCSFSGGPFRRYYWTAIGSSFGFSAFVMERVAPSPTPPVDTDQDGVIDTDELLIWLTNPLKSDTDGDGVSDGEEIKVGTNPLDPNSKPGPRLSLSRGGELCLPTTPGEEYQLEASSDLAGWEPFGEKVTGIGDVMCRSVPVSNPISRFWRARRLN